MRRATAGFTLIEMMVAVLIATAGVVLAAKVGQVIVRQSAKGRQNTSFRDRTGLLTKQLRADLRSAGIGATGAVAVDRTPNTWNQMGWDTPAGFFAIPVAVGANGAGGAVGGRTVVPGSDAIQLVVPDPASSVRTQGFTGAGQDVLVFELGATLNCPSNMVYVVDHTAPNGAGRSQVLFVDAYPPGAVDTRGTLQFTVAPGSEVMCARVSTYWTDTDGWLHRSDLSGPNVGLVPIGVAPNVVYVDPTNVATDVLGPGVLDLQIAYRVSSEVYTQNGVAAPVGQPQRMWIFEGVGGNADALMGTTQQWFEVRRVRISLLARNLRRIEAHTAGNEDIIRREDAAALPPLPFDRALHAEWVVATETLTNLRYFDMGAASGVPAEPY